MIPPSLKRFDSWFRFLALLAKGGVHLDRLTPFMLHTQLDQNIHHLPITDGIGCEENVPLAPIEAANRWGKQLFALPARGFDTLEFQDEKAGQAADMGLLSWLTGSVSSHLPCLCSILAVADIAASTNYHLDPAYSPLLEHFVQVSPHPQPYTTRMGALPLPRRQQVRPSRLARPVGRLRDACPAQRPVRY